jgi:hypothetical protein
MHEWLVNSRVQKIGEFIKLLIPEVMASSNCWLWLAVLVITSRPEK